MEKYLEAKKCLYKMIAQFYTVDDSQYKDQIKKEEQIDFHSQYIDVCFHQFKSDGLLAWKYLDLPKDFMTNEEIWDLESDIVLEKEEKDYEKKYWEISILLIDMTTKYYGRKLTLEQVIANHIPFDEELDEYGGEVDVCYHLCESAGEHVWNLLEIEEDVVGVSVFEKKRREFEEQLLKKQEDVKIYKK